MSVPDINAVRTNTGGLPGFRAMRDINLKLKISKRIGLTSSSLEQFSLGCASVRGQYIAVGTDNPEASQHFLTVVDAEVMLTKGQKEPVLCTTPVSEHISDVHWLNANTILCATGKGNLNLYHFDQEAKTLKHVGIMKDACGSYIREIGVKPGSANNIVLGGFDQKLNFLDLNRPDNPYVQRLDMQSVIGSVKWAPFQNNAYVSCGLDEGKFYLFDARQRISAAAFYMDSKKEDMFTHERYNDFNLLLGYGDGEFKHVDMRQANKVLATVQDPYVEAVGGIEFNQESHAFVISGYTDFSVWKVRNGEMAIHSHSKSGSEALKGKGYYTSATWYDATTVLSSDNSGGVGLFIQDWE